MLTQNYKEILILEDDVRFEKYFISKLESLIAELRQPSINWDLV